MKVNFSRVNPGGNITAIVEGNFDQPKRAKIVKEILCSDSLIEQVGFSVSTKQKNSDARLEMMGGEFCGNAMRSLGYALFRGSKKTSFLVETSGFKDPIKMNVSKKIASIKIPMSSFEAKNEVCSLPGISHIIENRKHTKEEVPSLIKKYGLTNKKAAGAISYEKKGAILSMFPLVWVKSTNTLYEETACGSAAMAIAFMFYKNTKVQKLKIRQPSGSVFTTKINRGILTLEGPILEIKEQAVNVTF